VRRRSGGGGWGLGLLLRRRTRCAAAGTGPVVAGRVGLSGAMQVEGEESQQVGGKGGSGLSISLHPLVIINISDHSTRCRALNGGKPKRVLGVLLGKLVPPPTAPRAFVRHVAAEAAATA